MVTVAVASDMVADGPDGAWVDQWNETSARCDIDLVACPLVARGALGPDAVFLLW
ncbi:MAG: hypothetical protein M0004_06480 [Actinomycetota bacterium]|nr:hypothetical protein [Actinomycetota bacterium]